MSEPGCYSCAGYGMLFFMPLGVRCCPSCVSTWNTYKLISPEVLEAAYGVTFERLLRSGAPMVKFIPSQMSRTYRHWEFGAPRIVLSDQKGWDVAMKFHGKEDTLMRYVNRRPKAKELHEARVRVSTRELYDTTDIRLRATTLLPYFNRETQTLEHGLCCRGCEGTVSRDKVYSRKDFIVHVKSCSRARRIIAAKAFRAAATA